ncbi:type II and III secretion system protein family protein [Sneathiella chinensis]|uniref:BON domain-containing protein n=1 Tax=Sneathiella chinensis TaxID=349750 RepID=A0ABQ5U3B7_9PROT|nr:type II and III secretion system protein family protein [Sneathiella chinensis]GLQ06562.1 hypothetical protein GCM10007924_17830 [Sneathiella chinensis]
MSKFLSNLAVAGLIFAFAAFLPKSAELAEVINDAGDPLQLTVANGKLIKLDRPAASVFVGNADLADVQVQSPTIIYVFAKTTGKTNLFALDNKGKVLMNSPVHISHDVESLGAALKDLDPTGGLKAVSMQTGIVLTGRAATPDVAEDARRLASLYAGDGNVFNRIVVEGSMQVNLRVQVAEVARSVTKQLGVNWENIATPGKFLFGLGTGRDLVQGTNILRSGNQSALALGFTDGTTSVSSVIDALEEEGLITVLAEPNLTALSGESASFLAGGEFPIPVPQDDGVISVAYKEFGVSLDFTPNIVGNRRINLKVRPEVSQLSSQSALNVGGVFVQSLITRRAETTVELASGQSFVLGGLLNSDQDNNVTKTPLLGDLPIIGSLFRSTAFQRNETELVIIVTPYLVEPVSSRIALPTDGYIPPNSNDSYVKGELFKPTAEAPKQSSGTPAPATALAGPEVKLVGPAGFIME